MSREAQSTDAVNAQKPPSVSRRDDARKSSSLGSIGSLARTSPKTGVAADQTTQTVPAGK